MTMENNCAYLAIEANYQTDITKFRIIYLSNSLMSIYVLKIFLLILRFLLPVPSLHFFCLVWLGLCLFFSPQSSFIPLARTYS